MDEFADFDMEAKHHEGEITDVPQNFKNWVGKNEERIENAILFPNDNFSAENFEDGYAKFRGLKGTPQYRKFKLIYCLSKDGIILTKKPSD